MPTLPLADAATALSATGLPLLLIDTCSLLDIIRRPIRSDDQREAVRETENAARVVELGAGTPPRLSVVATRVVADEWLTHRDEVRDEVRRGIEKHDSRAGVIHACIESVTGGTGRPTPRELAHDHVEDGLRAVAERVLGLATVIETDQTCELLAHRRNSKRIPPSRRGDQPKDCDILEHCLELCRRLDANRATRPRVFLSSNTRDYYGQQTTGLDPHLQAEFTAVKLQFATNLGQALHALGL